MSKIGKTGNRPRLRMDLTPRDIGNGREKRIVRGIDEGDSSRSPTIST